MTIAGHEFRETPSGRVCAGCGMLWTQIAGTQRDDIGQFGIAHHGTLYASEYEEIERERERIWQAVWEACSP